MTFQRHLHAGAEPAANRSRDPMGRRKRAEMRVREKDRRASVLLSLRRSDAASRNTV